MRTVNIISVVVVFINLSCASIVSKSNYPVTIGSNPEEASISIANEDGVPVYKGKTPTTFVLESGAGYFDGETYTVNFEKGGYISQTLILDSSVDGWYVGNIIFGGLIGFFLVDPLTGAMYKLPATAYATLSEIKDEQKIAEKGLNSAEKEDTVIIDVELSESNKELEKLKIEERSNQ